MEERKHTLLAEIVRGYVREACPVGSRALEGALGVSSATIRNDMAELEDEGYLYQPHTSAGRVPTLKGYQYFIDNLVKAHEPKPKEQEILRDLANELKANHELLVKSLARQMAEFTGEAVVVGFSPYDSYYTGLSNLFAQPEFAEVDMVRAMGRVIDHLDEAVGVLYKGLRGVNNVEVKIGSANPFGEDCALIFTSYNSSNNPCLVGLLGPLRMDYDANIGRLKYVRSLF